MSQEESITSRKFGRPLEFALSAGQSQPDRLPGLLAIMKLLSSEIVEEMKGVVYRQPRVRLLEVVASTYIEYGSVPPSGICGVLWAERWRQRLYAILDENTAQLFLEIALGGEATALSIREGRPYSKTECAILEVLYKRLARALTNAFSISVDVKFEVSNVAERLDEELACRATTPVIAVKLALDWQRFQGTFTLVIPQVALDPIREILAVAPAFEASKAEPPPDKEWSRQLSEEIARAFVTLNAVLEERPVALQEVQNFRVGGVVPLECTATTNIRLDAEEWPAFWCVLGQYGGVLSLCVDREFDPNEFADMEF